MAQLEMHLTKKQYTALEGLAYWIANLHYMRERYGKNEPELETCRKTIELCCFPDLDALHVPFWVQNSVICWAENWRNYKDTYFDSFLKTKNIFVDRKDI